jgi:DegV family protein with EDD domain
MNFELFTDSSANLTNEIINKYNINIISLIFISKGKEYISYVKDGENDLKQFYTMLRNKESLTTSCVNEDTFIKKFEPVLQQGRDILYIGFSSALSGTYFSGEKAIEKLKEKYPERKILCTNTLGASLGQGLLVIYAARMREEGKSIEEIFDWLEENRMKLCHYFTVDDLYYLFRGGRVKATKYLIANIINLKPIMHMDDYGRLIAIGKVIGRRKSLTTLADMVIKNIVESEKQTVCISHGDCIEDALYLKEKISKSINVKEWVIHYVDPVVGAHSGPGTIAIFFLGTNR